MTVPLPPPAAALLEFFLLGLATPLTATCVVPLYPSFIAYLASVGGRDEASGGDGTDGPSAILLGLLVVAGVLAFMVALGVVWTSVLQRSISDAVTALSPLAFAVLAVVGAVLVVAPNGFARLPTLEPPHSRYPTLSAFAYGFFFGTIVIPCNPGLIALFLGRSTVAFPAFDTQLEVLAGFLAFGLGIGTPLLALAVVSQSAGRRATRTLARYSGAINRLVGIVLVAVSLYYLIAVFEVVPLSH